MQFETYNQHLENNRKKKECEETKQKEEREKRRKKAEEEVRKVESRMQEAKELLPIKKTAHKEIAAKYELAKILKCLYNAGKQGKLYCKIEYKSYYRHAKSILIKRFIYEAIDYDYIKNEDFKEWGIKVIKKETDKDTRYFEIYYEEEISSHAMAVKITYETTVTGIEKINNLGIEKINEMLNDYKNQKESLISEISRLNYILHPPDRFEKYIADDDNGTQCTRHYVYKKWRDDEGNYHWGYR